MLRRYKRVNESLNVTWLFSRFEALSCAPVPVGRGTKFHGNLIAICHNLRYGNKTTSNWVSFNFTEAIPLCDIISIYIYIYIYIYVIHNNIKTHKLSATN